MFFEFFHKIKIVKNKNVWNYNYDIIHYDYNYKINVKFLL